MDARRAFGNQGEEMAARFLEAKGLVIEQTQYRTPFGEIDLVCRDGREVVFVEVKTRRTRTYGYPEEAITPAKFRTLEKCALAYLETCGLAGGAWRIDVVSVEVLPEGDPRVTHFPAIDSPAGNW